LLQDVVSVFFYGEISHAGEEKKTLANPTKNFIFFKSPYLEEKKLKVAIFRQCAPVGRQN
jgi:hypothetical protein